MFLFTKASKPPPAYICLNNMQYIFGEAFFNKIAVDGRQQNIYGFYKCLSPFHSSRNRLRNKRLRIDFDLTWAGVYRCIIKHFGGCGFTIQRQKSKACRQQRSRTSIVSRNKQGLLLLLCWAAGEFWLPAVVYSQSVVCIFYSIFFEENNKYA